MLPDAVAPTDAALWPGCHFGLAGRAKHPAGERRARSELMLPDAVAPTSAAVSPGMVSSRLRGCAALRVRQDRFFPKKEPARALVLLRMAK